MHGFPLIRQLLRTTETHLLSVYVICIFGVFSVVFSLLWLWTCDGPQLQKKMNLPTKENNRHGMA